MVSSLDVYDQDIIDYATIILNMVVYCENWDLILKAINPNIYDTHD